MPGRESRRNDERLYFKFIAKYFEGLHEELFEKAVDLFHDAKEKNPTVKDLTKTVQFMAAVTPEIPIPRYYKNRQPKVHKKPQMVLQIQLLGPQELAMPQPSPLPNPQELAMPQPSPLPNPQELAMPQPSPLPNPQELAMPQPSPLPNPQELAMPQPSPLPNPQELAMPQPSPLPNPQELATPFPFLTQSVYNDLVTEIQQDQELQKILDDFPNISDDDIMNDLVWNEVWNDISPVNIF